MLMNIKETAKYKNLEKGFTKPHSTSDLDINFMECMEQIEFAGNDNYIRHQYSALFNAAREFWFPQADKYDFFDDLYNRTEELVA